MLCKAHSVPVAQYLVVLVVFFVEHYFFFCPFSLGQLYCLSVHWLLRGPGWLNELGSWIT